MRVTGGRPTARATGVRRVIREHNIYGSFAQEAVQQHLHPDDLLRQLMVAYIAARAMRRQAVRRSRWNVLDEAAHAVADQPPPYRPR